VKNANDTAVILKVSYGKEAENSFVLNVRRHCEDVTYGGRLFQVLAAATGNARSPIVKSRVIAEVDDERRRCRPGSPATGCRASAR